MADFSAGVTGLQPWEATDLDRCQSGRILRIRLDLSHSIDLQTWARAYDDGRVPDRLPYGLNHLEAHKVEIITSPVVGRQRRRINGALRRVGRYQWGEQWTRSESPVDLRLAWSETAGVPAVLRNDAPVVSGVIWATEPGRRRAGLGCAFRRMAAVWALSDAQLPVLREVFGVTAARLHHITFGIDAEFFTPEGGVDESLVVSAGNDRHRDHPCLLQAMRHVRGTRSGVRLELVSRQPLQVDSPDVRIASLPHNELRARYRRAALVVVMTSSNLHVSGITAVLEAMACGRPVVVSDTPGMRHYVDHGRTGLLVPVGDHEACARAIATLTTDRAMAFEMGALARRSVESRFTTRHQSAALARLARAALSE